MSAELFEFPTPPLASNVVRPSRFNCVPPVAYRRYSFADLVRLFALEDLERRTQINRLRLMVLTKGLPQPLNPRQWGKRLLDGADAIHSRSQWDAAAVDAWRAQPGPGPSAPAAHPPLPPRLHDQLRANALRLAGQ